MQQLAHNETAGPLRRFPVHLVTGEGTGITGLTFAAGAIKLSKNGAPEQNHAGTVTELGGGLYAYQATAAEVDTLGFLSARFANTLGPEGVTVVQIVEAAALSAAARFIPKYFPPRMPAAASDTRWADLLTRVRALEVFAHDLVRFANQFAR
jgi:hypothetical protein